MKALNAYLGDGTTRVKKVYRGNDLIYWRPPEHYIQSAISYTTVSEGNGAGYIYVDDKELYSNYRYEVDAEFSWSQARIYTFMGGLFGSSSVKPGLMFATSYNYYETDDSVGLFDFDQIAEDCYIPNCRQVYTADTRRTYSFQNTTYTPYSPMSGDTYCRTDGGFFIMNCRGSDGNPAGGSYTRPDGFYNENGKIYRISVYDTDGTTLLMNFIPRVYNGVLGMEDTVDGHFYPCSSNSDFLYDGNPVATPTRSLRMSRSVRASNLFDGITKVYYNQTEVPLINIQDRWWWDKFNYDIRKFEIVEEEEE